MSLYNKLFGTDVMADVLLACLGLDRSRVPRFRDCYTMEGQIVIYTRTGGGNRDFYDSEASCRAEYPEYFDGKDDPSGPWNADLQALQNYLYDEDDGFDSTYASFYFSIPDEYKDEIAAMSSGKEPVTPSEKWKELLESLQVDRA